MCDFTVWNIFSSSLATVAASPGSSFFMQTTLNILTNADLAIVRMEARMGMDYIFSCLGFNTMP